MNYALLAIGLVLLVKGADIFVTGACGIARRLQIPSLVVGLTIVAFGTSAPEAAVSVVSALNGQSDLAIGNIMGSNLFNLLFVVGTAACILPFKVKETIIAKEFPFVLLTCLVILILMLDKVWGSDSNNMISRSDGLILLTFLGIFMYYLLSVALAGPKEDEETMTALPIGRSVIFLLIGLMGVVFGGDMTVDAASAIALRWGMSETLVGLTIVGVGTSLPELMTSYVAARKGDSDIALGNVIGSNVFNVFFILGMSAVISPIAVSNTVIIDGILLLFITVVAFLFALSGRRFSKGEGICLMMIYGVYLGFVIWRS